MDLDKLVEKIRAEVSVDKIIEENILMKDALYEWMTAREGLADWAHKNNPTPEKWGNELSRRCMPLREFCNRLFYAETYVAPGVGRELPTANKSDLLRKIHENRTSKDRNKEM